MIKLLMNGLNMSYPIILDLYRMKSSYFLIMTKTCRSKPNGLIQLRGGQKPLFDAREQQLKRISLPIINLEHLSDEHTYLYSQTWCALDALVEITNGALVVKPFRREPP